MITVFVCWVCFSRPRINVIHVFFVPWPIYPRVSYTNGRTLHTKSHIWTGVALIMIHIWVLAHNYRPLLFKQRGYMTHNPTNTWANGDCPLCVVPVPKHCVLPVFWGYDSSTPAVWQCSIRMLEITMTEHCVLSVFWRCPCQNAVFYQCFWGACTRNAVFYQCFGVPVPKHCVLSVFWGPLGRRSRRSRKLHETPSKPCVYARVVCGPGSARFGAARPGPNHCVLWAFGRNPVFYVLLVPYRPKSLCFIGICIRNT